MITILGIIAIILFIEVDIAFIFLLMLMFSILKNRKQKGGD